MIKNKIIKKIKENNKSINIENYTKICLYDQKGYYHKNNILGQSGDFITAPEISQLFGEIIGLFIFSYWKKNINQKFNLIELGPGKGTLLIDILNITKNFSDFKKNLNIKLIEKNINFIKIQKKNLEKKKYNLEKIDWIKNFFKLPKLPSIIYGNEFLDCLPIRQFYKKKQNWYEKLINFNDNLDLFIEDGLIKDTKTLSILNSKYHNDILEISEEREKYFGKICSHLYKYKGICIIIDYGYYDPIKNFSIQSLYKHQKTSILSNPGMQDITSLVDFKNLIDIAKKNNLKINTFCNQKKFLLSNGIKERKNKILEKCNLSEKKMIKNGFNRLIDINNMGSLFKVLVISS